MARINLEDSLYSDVRFMRLLCALRDPELALEIVVSAWQVAQRHWVRGQELVPEEKWRYIRHGDVLLEIGLARRSEAGIYVCGSTEHFAWLINSVEAGRRGGRKRSKVDPFWQSDEWRTLRYQALALNGRACLACGRDDQRLHVDHIKPRSRYPELSLELGNLQILCEECNLGKGAWDETDWRKPVLRKVE